MITRAVSEVDTVFEIAVAETVITLTYSQSIIIVNAVFVAPRIDGSHDRAAYVMQVVEFTPHRQSEIIFDTLLDGLFTHETKIIVNLRRRLGAVWNTDCRQTGCSRIWQDI